MEQKADAATLASILRDTANTGSIMRELGDLKSKIDVQGAETQNIKTAINEIKIDVKEIKSDYPNRREFNEAIRTLKEENPAKDFEDRLRMLERFRWILVGGLLAYQTIATYILYSILHR